MSWAFAFAQAVPLASAQECLRQPPARERGALLAQNELALTRALEPYVEQVGLEATRLPNEVHTARLQVADRGGPFRRLLIERLIAHLADVHAPIEFGSVSVTEAPDGGLLLAVDYRGPEGNPAVDRLLIDAVREVTGESSNEPAPPTPAGPTLFDALGSPPLAPLLTETVGPYLSVLEAAANDARDAAQASAAAYGPEEEYGEDAEEDEGEPTHENPYDTAELHLLGKAAELEALAASRPDRLPPADAGDAAWQAFLLAFVEDETARAFVHRELERLKYGAGTRPELRASRSPSVPIIEFTARHGPTFIREVLHRALREGPVEGLMVLGDRIEVEPGYALLVLRRDAAAPESGSPDDKLKPGESFQLLRTVSGGSGLDDEGGEPAQPDSRFYVFVRYTLTHQPPGAEFDRLMAARGLTRERVDGLLAQYLDDPTRLLEYGRWIAQNVVTLLPPEHPVRLVYDLQREGKLRPADQLNFLVEVVAAYDVVTLALSELPPDQRQAQWEHMSRALRSLREGRLLPADALNVLLDARVERDTAEALVRWLRPVQAWPAEPTPPDSDYRGSADETPPPAVVQPPSSGAARGDLPESSQPAFEFTASAPISVEEALLRHLPEQVQGIRYVDGAFEVQPGSALMVHRAREEGAVPVTAAETLQPGDTLVLLRTLSGGAPEQDEPGGLPAQPPSGGRPSKSPYERLVQQWGDRLGMGLGSFEPWIRDLVAEVLLAERSAAEALTRLSQGSIDDSDEGTATSLIVAEQAILGFGLDQAGFTMSEILSLLKKEVDQPGTIRGLLEQRLGQHPAGRRRTPHPEASLLLNIVERLGRGDEELLGLLNENERRVITMLFGSSGMSPEEAARVLQVPLERIQELERTALDKIRAHAGFATSISGGSGDEGGGQPAISPEAETQVRRLLDEMAPKLLPGRRDTVGALLRAAWSDPTKRHDDQFVSQVTMHFRGFEQDWANTWLVAKAYLDRLPVERAMVESPHGLPAQPDWWGHDPSPTWAARQLADARAKAASDTRLAQEVEEAAQVIYPEGEDKAPAAMSTWDPERGVVRDHRVIRAYAQLIQIAEGLPSNQLDAIAAKLDEARQVRKLAEATLEMEHRRDWGMPGEAFHAVATTNGLTREQASHLVAQLLHDQNHEGLYGGRLLDLDPADRSIAQALLAALPVDHPVQDAYEGLREQTSLGLRGNTQAGLIASLLLPLILGEETDEELLIPAKPGWPEQKFESRLRQADVSQATLQALQALVWGQTMALEGEVGVETELLRLRRLDQVITTLLSSSPYGGQPAQPSQPAFEFTASAPISVEEALLRHLPEQVQGIRYVDGAFEVQPGSALMVHRAREEGAVPVTAAETLQPGDTLVLLRTLSGGAPTDLFKPGTMLTTDQVLGGLREALTRSYRPYYVGAYLVRPRQQAERLVGPVTAPAVPEAIDFSEAARLLAPGAYYRVVELEDGNPEWLFFEPVSEAAADPVQAFVEEAKALGITADAKRLEAAFWAPALKETSTAVVSPQMARSHARLTHPFWVVVHSSVYDAPGSDAVQQRLLAQLEELSKRVELPEGVDVPELLRQGALRIAVVVDGAETPEEAEAYRLNFLNELGLPETFFQQAVPGNWNAEQLHRALTSAQPGSILASLVGPTAWLDELMESDDLLAGGAVLVDVAQVPFEGSAKPGMLAAGGNAIAAGIELGARVAAAAAGDRRQPPPIPGRQQVFTGLELVPEHAGVAEEFERADAIRRQRLRAVRAASVRA